MKNIILISSIVFVLLAVNVAVAMNNPTKKIPGGAGGDGKFILPNETDYILSRITDSKGKVDAKKLAEYLASLK